mmetsp:Transcript_103565/g.194960  ORF Transcript_103565/g.194960 Transcript_103565/m.194960 type:complete len:751 (+) Transcript_103565:59-2311(+)
MQAAMRALCPCSGFPALFIALAAVSSCVANGSVGTPVEKVVKLLKGLQKTVEDQYTKDASQYEAYATFCKEQTRIKTGAIAKSEEQIKVLEADETDLKAKISAINSRLGEISTELTAKEGEKEDAEAARSTELETYLKEAKDYADAIEATEKAIEAMKESKVDMKDARTDAPTSLAQQKLDPSASVLHKYIKDVRAAAVNPDVEALARAINFFRQDAAAPESPEKTVAYTYHANDIIAVLRALFVQFKDEKEALDKAEAENKFDFNKKILNLNNEMTFLKQEQTELKVELAEAQSALSETTQAKDAETADKTSDGQFKADLEQGCTDKATQWTTREQTLKDELTALKSAIATLEEGEVEKMYGANKKLTSLVHGKATTKTAVRSSSKTPKVEAPRSQPAQKVVAKRAISFLQVRGADHQREKQEAVLHRLLKHLDTSAGRLRSSPLAALSLRVQAGEAGPDYFVKVRGIIKDLMAKLKADAQDEVTSKSFCDTEMKKSLQKRDSNNLEIEAQNSIIAAKTAKKNKLNEEIDALEVEIADLHKVLDDETKRRAAEKAANDKTIADASSGQSTTEEAKTILKTFYDKHSLLQVNYKPPDSDRYDETVGDRAPEVFGDAKYKGKQASAKGILGLLDVIISDFKRTVSTVTAAESKAVQDFNKFKTDTNNDIDAKGLDKKAKEDEVDTLTSDLQSAASTLETATENRDTALAELSTLKTSCVQGEETYEERVAKREEEIAALKEALQILIDWKG